MKHEEIFEEEFASSNREQHRQSKTWHAAEATAYRKPRTTKYDAMTCLLRKLGLGNRAQAPHGTG